MKLTNSRRVAAIAVALTAGIVLAGCTGGGTDAEGGGGSTLTIWAAPTNVEAMKPIVPAFEDKYDVKIELVTKPVESINTTVLQQSPTGSGPDVFEDGAADRVVQYADNGVIAPITIAEPSKFTPVAISNVTYKGQTWAMPVSMENVALYRNTDLVPNAPTDFADLVAQGEALVAAGTTKYPFFVQSGQSGAADPYHLWPLMTSFGINAYEVSADGTYNTDKFDLGGEGGARWANQLAEWGRSGILNSDYTYDIGLDAFVKGETPFLLSGPWALPTFEGKVNFSVDPVPSAGGETASPFVGTQAFYVNKYSKNQVLANRFVADYLATKDAQLGLFTASLRAPALIAAAESPEVTSNTSISDFGKAAETGVAPPGITSFGALYTAVGQLEGAIISGKSTDPAADWQAMVDKVEAEADAG